ncbi:MAG: NUDIX hydrolase [Syntrophobacteraceae bacterium]
MEERIRTLGSIHANHFSAHLDVVRLRTGRLTERIRIDHPEAAAVVPFLDSNRILMVRQWRYAIARETLEIPAGKADPGEDLEACARRELHEETGYNPERLVELFSYFPAIGYSNEVIRIYAASRLQKLSSAQDEDEISQVEIVDLAKIYDLIAEGAIQDGKTVIGLSLFKARMECGELPENFFG